MQFCRKNKDSDIIKNKEKNKEGWQEKILLTAKKRTVIRYFLPGR